MFIIALTDWTHKAPRKKDQNVQKGERISLPDMLAKGVIRAGWARKETRKMG
jgi:hypothetical protein